VSEICESPQPVRLLSVACHGSSQRLQSAECSAGAPGPLQVVEEHHHRPTRRGDRPPHLRRQPLCPGLGGQRIPRQLHHPRPRRAAARASPSHAAQPAPPRPQRLLADHRPPGRNSRVTRVRSPRWTTSARTGGSPPGGTRPALTGTPGLRHRNLHARPYPVRRPTPNSGAAPSSRTTSSANRYISVSRGNRPCAGRRSLTAQRQPDRVAFRAAQLRRPPGENDSRVSGEAGDGRTLDEAGHRPLRERTAGQRAARGRDNRPGCAARAVGSTSSCVLRNGGLADRPRWKPTCSARRADSDPAAAAPAARDRTGSRLRAHRPGGAGVVQSA
jgi:hypothetical protein